MNAPSNAVPESPNREAAAPAARSAVRPFYWSVRRELWENRWVYLAPLAVAGVALAAFLVSLATSPGHMPSPLPLGPAEQHPALERSWGASFMWIYGAVLVVGWFYCLEALQGERRDRSILFWKSLPVSDLTAVLAKAAIPFLVLPLLSLALIFATQLAMLILGTAVPQLSGRSAAAFWAQLPSAQLSVLLLYFVAVLTLWHAPIYGWWLLVSAWARRAALLWAVLPLILINIAERIAFGTSYFASLLSYRWVGFFKEAFVFQAGGTVTVKSLPRITPGDYLASPGLWVGLAFTAACLAAAVRLRRHKDPI